MEREPWKMGKNYTLPSRLGDRDELKALGLVSIDLILQGSDILVGNFRAIIGLLLNRAGNR